MLATAPPTSPHDYSLHRLHHPSTPPTPPPKAPASPHTLLTTWFAALTTALAAGATPAHLATVFHAESWWRDHLALSWDLRTLHTLPRIAAFVSAQQPVARLADFRVAEGGAFAAAEAGPAEGLRWVEGMFGFSSAWGVGKGVVRLVEGEGGWRCCMFYAALQELRGVVPAVGAARPRGGDNSLGGRGSWLDRRRVVREFEGVEPDVVVVGAGQAGLNVAARLQHLGLSCLLLEKNARVGDNWRCRYRTLVTHDPVQYTHMYGLPFPESWPTFTPKDKLGDWFEAYASLMELNVWTSTTIKHTEYSDATKTWTIDVLKGDASPSTPRTLHPKHVVFCTGHAGEPKIPSFPGQAAFRGLVYHGSQHQDATETPVADLGSKRVVVVGTGNSGHDIAQNYHEAGAAAVTMLQRSGTYVLQADKGLFMLHEGMYDQDGPPTEDADVYGQSLPIPVQFALNVGLTERIRERERENVEGLTRAGFKIDYGHDGSGIYRKYVTRGGGYYIDVGGSQLIIGGKIKVVQSPDGIKGFEPDALVLADGRKLPADIVVLATGYDNMRTSLRKIMGDKVADRAKDVWDLDEEGEVNAMWRPSGHPRLWFMGGSLALCRLYSRQVALQIKAIEEGLSDG
ncbi:Flavin-containing monooxygenase-like protein [Neofusicoccum parvum]|uniref:Flavin-containing monooxygenase-like protein n=1 Tax=Neofusicoccum parvum TaxID=310453 RepID=A0ACB5SE26_9PEZI|nr:Flavin-containing monooxygenase-like protein [Neofusicoccum parvum]